MRKFKMELREVLSDVVCDVCGLSCLRDGCYDPLMADFATLEATWGYCSNGKDGDHYKCDICETCFDKIVAMIDSIKSAPNPTNP